MMPIVKVSEGTLRGTTETLSSGETFYSFRGIPYAQPPVGELRFKDPEPLLPWEGVREASEHGPICPQFNPLETQGNNNSSEDCLYLNVYTKTLNVNSRTPVMLWIHGGAFVMGSGNSKMYGPDYLIKNDIVLVTINYRLEAFGFLCLDNSEVPGNAGMKDQVAAMKWVKENIKMFGGDPDDVTIFGESAGGASVALQLVSPLAQGLFSKAIIQSGSSLCEWALNIDNGKKFAFLLSKLLGKEITDEKELMNYLRSVPAEDLVNVTAKFKEIDVKMPFIPIIEKRVPGVSNFLNKHPIDYLTSGEFPDIPVVLGVTSGEAILIIKEELSKSETLNSLTDWGVMRELKNMLSPEEIQNLNREIKKFYFGNNKISPDTVVELVKIESDYHFVYPTYRLASLLSQKNSSPVYFYHFTFVDDNNMMNKIFKGEYKSKLPFAAHGAEVSCLFSNVFSKLSDDPSCPIAATTNNVSLLWTSFAKTGNPTPDKKLGVKWGRFSPELKTYLEIDVPLRTRNNLLADRMQFWTDMLKKYRLPS